jgi:hypothetical protein
LALIDLPSRLAGELVAGPVRGLGFHSSDGDRSTSLIKVKEMQKNAF